MQVTLDILLFLWLGSFFCTFWYFYKVSGSQDNSQKEKHVKMQSDIVTNISNVLRKSQLT